MRETAMAKVFLSLGFWMTIVLFVALGYALGNAFGSECAGSINCRDGRLAFTPPLLQDENRSFENDLRAEHFALRNRCALDATPYSNTLDFQQMANLQGGGPTYAPGLSFAIEGQPPRMSICPGPIEIPRH
jgi:hypothetical protein